ncbi:NAD-dependent epimerase [Fuerstiella marisgermanici]|uniref:dTDP-glucose 4,6-dehydratase 2 n=1 Tax=Fuerstiella marisgermanici TaxID=1891926 RepID=A0A1P8WHM0_9PLAN|nr:NAD-dependent epimerase [Fuerstiella marisgermanici]APZ93561.1 dTDP-glucose 4,6-dehydratase 2 [Fuerstiella marisgermanici]
MAKILVTGAAGFIGMHTATSLLERGDEVVGLDNINDYYSLKLKHDRMATLEGRDGFTFAKLGLEDRDGVAKLFADQKFDSVIHLAAQAGVRYSLENPHAYVDSNLVGFVNILEACRHNNVGHLAYASSSSVYGANKNKPFRVSDRVDHPVSLYAASKKANELMAHTYSHLFGLPTTGLRFFTVYGPWGRPDMALWLFTEAILNGKPINVFNHGKMRRDFTYVDDIVEGVIRVNDNVPTPNPDKDPLDDSTTAAPYRIYNIGNNQPVELMHMIETLEKCLGRTAEKNMMDIQQGDVPETFADIDALQADVGFRPDTSIESGIERFVDWYKTYHDLS